MLRFCSFQKRRRDLGLLEYDFLTIQVFGGLVTPAPGRASFSAALSRNARAASAVLKVCATVIVFGSTSTNVLAPLDRGCVETDP